MKYLENKTIVVPFDFSDSSRGAIDQALEMAEETTGILVVFVVVPAPAFVSCDPAIPLPPSFDQERLEQSLEQMKQQFADSRYARLQFKTVLGDAGSEIVACARDAGAEMIIMPSHGRTGIQRLMVGSVAERVTRLASCPVLVLRGQE